MLNIHNRIRRLLTYLLFGLVFSFPISVEAFSTQDTFSFSPTHSTFASTSISTSSPNKANVKPFEEDYAVVDNGKLYYQSHGKGPVIILLHGGPGLDQTYLLPQMLELAKNHQLVLYDQRGSGKSLSLDIFSNEKINMAQFVKDLEGLREHLGKRKIILMGHAFGGLLALHYAMAHQERVSAIVLMNPFPISVAGLEAFVTEYNKRLLPLKPKMDEILTSKAFLAGNPDSIKEFYHTLFSFYFYDQSLVTALSLNHSLTSALSGLKISKAFMHSYFTKTLEIKPELKKLNIPTLIIAGEADIVPGWATKEIDSSIPKSKMIMIKQSGHFPYIEKPEIFFKEINQFIEINGQGNKNN